MAHEPSGAPSAQGALSAPLSPPPPPFLTGRSNGRGLDLEHVAEADYVLIRSTGPVDASECEDARLAAVEVTVLWGNTVLSVTHLTPPRPYTVGHGEGAEVDYVLPRELSPVACAPIVALENGTARALAPEGAVLVGDDVSFGALTFRVRSVVAGKRVPRAIGMDARGVGGAFAVSVASVAAFMGALAYYTPALGASLDSELDRDRIDAMRVYLQAQAERERDRQQEDAGKTAQPEGGGTPGEAAKGPEGKMGRPERPSVNKRTAIAGTGDVVLSRESALKEAQTFGLVGMLASMNARALPSAVWGADIPNGPDASDAWGELFGKEPGESGGLGGLGLSGVGDGGGGLGRGIGLGSIGTCGTNCGMGPGRGGIGWSVGTTGPGHHSSAPRLRTAGPTTVNGHIPAEVIQRVVRQNYGRFRACYENGLRTNPNLTGRVTARFVIGRDGSVTTVANGGSDLPNSSVVSCVVTQFYGLSFPAPDGGVVSVIYPIMFTPG
jgi:hypothetical protein